MQQWKMYFKLERKMPSKQEKDDPKSPASKSGKFVDVEIIQNALLNQDDSN